MGRYRAAVLGMGNVLMGDDGVGPYVIRVLEAGWEFPPDVAVIDVGTPGLNLIPYVGCAGSLILVDTVNSEGPPGSVGSYGKDEVLRRPLQPRLSPHDPGLGEALLALELAGAPPESFLLLGVIPARTGMGPGLSPEVQKAVPRMVRAVLEELRRVGLAARPRVPAAAPDIWWEAQTGSMTRSG